MSFACGNLEKRQRTKLFGAHVKHNFFAFVTRTFNLLATTLDLPSKTTNHGAIKPTHTVHLSGNQSGRIRKLSGFNSSHHVPDGHHEAANAFVRRAGAEEVRSLAQKIHADLRQALEYKRRDFDFRDEDGFAVLNTPDFELEIRLDQDSEDAKLYTREVRITKLHRPEIAQNPAFQHIFNAHCHRLSIYFAEQIDLEAKIDALEAIPEVAAGLNYPPDASTLELRLPQLDLILEITTEEMHFQLLTLPNLPKLIEHSQRTFDILTEAGFDLRFAPE